MRLQDLQSASFRGARFLVPRDTAEEGRNTIEHNYPDSSRRYLEDNGALPANFDVTAILHGPNVAGQWAALRSALTRPGPGTLRHPWYGRHRVAVMGRFRVTREDRRLGVLELTIPFGVTSGGSFPVLLSGIPAVVGNLASAAIAAAIATLARNWVTGTSAVTSNALAGELVNVAGALSGGLGVRMASAADILGAPHNKVASPDLLSTCLNGLFLEPFSNLDLDGATLVRGYKKVCPVVDEIYASASAIRIRTQDTELRQRQLIRLADYVQAANFSALSWAMADRDHRTADEVSDDEAILHELRERIQETDIDSDTHAQVSDVYTAIGEVLADKLLRVPRIVSIPIEGYSASALSYQLYDSHDRTQTLIDLNPFDNPIWIDGAANVLTEV